MKNAPLQQLSAQRAAPRGCFGRVVISIQPCSRGLCDERRIARVVYFGFGSNLGNREETLRLAVNKLQTPDLRLLRVSSVYETEPMGLKEQPWFLNMVAAFESSLTPFELLARAQQVEQELGRIRTVPNGPRTIDIDLLLCGDTIVRSAELDVPHPRYRERRFVLEPLVELDAALKDPATKERLSDILAGLRGQEVRKR